MNVPSSQEFDQILESMTTFCSSFILKNNPDVMLITDNIVCVLCGGLIVERRPVKTNYCRQNILDHFMLQHHGMRAYRDLDKFFMWCYSNYIDDLMMREVFRIDSNLISGTFPQLMYLGWQTSIVDLLLKFGPEENSVKKGAFNVREIIDNADALSNTILNQSYTCLKCGYMFDGAPCILMLADHLRLRCCDSTNPPMRTT